jgi:hypothetical protein
MGLVPRGVLDGDHALVGGLVRERGARHQVADRVHVLRRRPQPLVDRHETALVGLHARLVEPELLGVR